MKLLTMSMMSDEEGNLILPALTLRGLESDATFTMQIGVDEEESEENTLCIPRILLDDAGLDASTGLQVMTGDGMVVVCQRGDCDITGIIAGGK